MKTPVAACRQDPSVRPDGLCVVCKKPRVQKRAAKGDKGIRMDETVWLASVAVDPFCSSPCCQAWHKTGGPTVPVAITCDGCGVEVPGTRSDRRWCSDKCKDAARRKGRAPRAKGMCVGCGADLANRTTGCPQCWERARRRVLRQDPAWVAKENASRHAYKQRQRDQRKSTAAARPTRTVKARAAAKEAKTI